MTLLTMPALDVPSDRSDVPLQGQSRGGFGSGPVPRCRSLQATSAGLRTGMTVMIFDHPRQFRPAANHGRRSVMIISVDANGRSRVPCLSGLDQSIIPVDVHSYYFDRAVERRCVTMTVGVTDVTCLGPCCRALIPVLRVLSPT